ncbi:carbohydrate-binding protein, partial [Gemmiger formicilis]
VQVHTGITAQKDGHLGFTGLNAWQPLGVTAQAGEELIIYVGSNNGTTGSNAALQLVVTQYNAEYGQLSKSIALKIGRNEIMVPELVTFDAEHVGPLYVQYTGNNSADQYSVRVSGGVQIPVLDLYGIDDAGEREARVTAYVEELESYTAGLEAQHGTLH